MPGNEDRHLVLVVRRTRLDELVARYNTVAQAQFYIEHLGADFADYLAEHRRYQAAVAEAAAVLRRFGRVQRLERGLLPSFLFPPGALVPGALVVVLGQDGLVANTLKYAGARPVIGVNPDPARWDGVLLPFGLGDLPRIVPLALAGRRPLQAVTMARARLQDGQELSAVNDLFIGARSHVSARYEIAAGGQRERQSSSGIIVSTGLGSTGWFRSLLAGAARLAGTLAGDGGEGEAGARRQLLEHGFPWEAAHLYFTVREPFPSRTTGTSLVFGRIAPGAPLQVVSAMAEGGVIFSDGVEADRLAFDAGMTAVVDLAPERGQLVR